MPKHKNLKDSGIEWVGAIPEHWSVKPLFALFHERQAPNHGNKVPNVLSLSYGKIIRRDIESNFGLLPESFETYNVIVPGNIVLRLTDLQNDKRSLRCGFVEERGIITSAYVTLETNKNSEIFPPYAFYLLHSWDIRKVFYGMGGGVRQVIKFSDLKRLPIFMPPLEEQRQIVEYLRKKTLLIDDLIFKKEKMVVALKEKRTVVISHAVTKGINPEASMKESGIDWLGDIPAHWKLLAIKRLTSVKRGASPRPIDDPQYFDSDGEYSWVRIADVTASERYLTATTQRLSKLGKSLSVPLEPGTIFLSIAGSVGKPIITKIKCCIHDGFVYFPQYRYNPEFLYYVFASGQPYLGLGKFGTQLNLNTDTVGNIILGLPPEEEQAEIVRRLDHVITKLDILIKNTEDTIIKLHELRTAMIYELVTGKKNIASLSKMEMA